MILDWKKLTNEEKSKQLPKIGELRGVGFQWKEIGEFYGVSEETIRDYYKDHKLPNSPEIGESIILNNEPTTNITIEMLASLMDKMQDYEAKFSKLESDTARINTATIGYIEEVWPH